MKIQHLVLVLNGCIFYFLLNSFDLVKEFIYHYESQYETVQKSEEIPEGNEFWTTLHIIQVLEEVVEKSNIYKVISDGLAVDNVYILNII